MEVTVIGCGRWGSFIAWYLDKIGNNVTLYGRENSKKMQEFKQTRKNNLITLPETIALSTQLDIIDNSEIIVISINSQNLSALMKKIGKLNVYNKTIVLCMKGIEISTGKRLTEIVKENVDKSNSVCVWLGPGHVQEFFNGTPNCMVIDSDDTYTKEKLVNQFSSELIRFYYGNDIIGSEIGGATKNVIGIAAGMLDGLNLSTLKGALMSRGTKEVAKLVCAMGGNELSAYGLCHLGDYEATVFSPFSNNRKFGEAYVKGESFEKLAEGYYTAQALMTLKERYNVDMPISTSVYDILYNNCDPKYEIKNLFYRSLKNELI